MFSLIFSLVLLVVAFVVFKLLPSLKITGIMRGTITGAIIAMAAIINFNGLFAYNDAGYCQHIRTIAGTEKQECDVGWYVIAYGKSTPWPWAITISHTNRESDEGSNIMPPYSVRMADNWAGEVIQATRFEIPKDDRFLDMAKVFRSPDRLISTTLLPAVTASLDSVANLYTMEEYYAGGKRDQFKTEYRDAVEKGRAVVRQVTDSSARKATVSKVAPSDSEVAQDTSEVGELSSQRTYMEKILGEDGLPKREQHDYAEYGVRVASAILENLDPDDRFEAQIQARKDAASRRIVAQEQRKEQEEQRLLAIQTGQTQIAKRQADAQVEQIEKTTNAETAKRLALIEAERQKEEAAIQRDTSKVLLEKAKIDAQAVQVAADATAYEKREILQADNALAQKLEAEIAIQKVWAEAFAKRQVPTNVYSTGGAGGATTGSDSEVKQFMQLMTMDAAKRLNYDREVKK